jgi:hypothetical protein
MWWLLEKCSGSLGRCGDSLGGCDCSWEMWWLREGCGGQWGDVVTQWGDVVALGKCGGSGRDVVVNGRCGDPLEGCDGSWQMWWLRKGCVGQWGDVVTQWGDVVALGKCGGSGRTMSLSLLGGVNWCLCGEMLWLR